MYPPYQMNQNAAAKYLCISVSTFKTHYRPHLKQCKEGGVVYFLKNDIEKYCRSRFINNTATTASKAPKSKTGDAYQNALRKLKVI